MSRYLVRSILLGLALGLMLPAVASATWPGSNGKIFFTCSTAVGLEYADICSINPDGTALVNLTNTAGIGEQQPATSLDGSRVTFVRGNSGDDRRAWVMNADGSGALQVTTVPTDGPSFTPFGQIAYRAKVGTNTYQFELVAPAPGSAPAVLQSANVTGSSYPPQFTRSGAYLYARSVQIPSTLTWTQQIFKVEGGSETMVTQPTIGVSSNQQPSWSPDATKILFWRMGGANDDIWSVASSGGDPVQVTNTPDSVAAESTPSYSPDGARMVWTQTDATYDFFNSRIAVAAADGSGATLLAIPGYMRATSPFWAPAQSSVKAAFTATAAKKLKRSKRLSLTLRCIGDTWCDVTDSATLVVPGKKRGKSKSYKIKGTVTQLSPGGQKVIKIGLPKKAGRGVKAALKAKKKPTLKVTVTAVQPGGPLIRKQLLKVRIVK